MIILRSGAGLTPEFPSPPLAPGLWDVVTDEAAVLPPPGQKLHIVPLVAEGEQVRAGTAVACLRHAPTVCLVAPITGQIARIDLSPGRILNEIVLFRDGDDTAAPDPVPQDLSGAETDAGLRRLLQGAGVWPWIGRRPFGGMPKADEVPSAILVQAADTRPLAPDPELALEGRLEAFGRGLAALARLTDGPIFVTWPDTRPMPDFPHSAARITWLPTGPRHPQGSAGIRLHDAFPPGLETPVWDIHAEDVAHIGDLLTTGVLPMTRQVRMAGAALNTARMLRTTAGADLRQLVQGAVLPGPHRLLSGGPLNGRLARWLDPRDRTVCAIPPAAPRPARHWLIAALTDSAQRRPIIPTAALTQAFGAALPAVPLLRAMGAGDEDAAMRLGVLSLLEEDVALADYVLGAGGDVQRQLRDLLTRIETEYAA